MDEISQRGIVAGSWVCKVELCGDADNTDSFIRISWVILRLSEASFQQVLHRLYMLHRSTLQREG